VVTDGTITVTVVDAETGATLCNAGGVQCGYGYVGTDGVCNVQCTRPPGGDYTVSVSAPGYQPGKTTVAGVAGTCGHDGTDATVTLRLTPACNQLVTHDNGLGQQWTDCVSPYTYNGAEAQLACAAAGLTCAVVTCSLGDGGSEQTWCSANAGTSPCDCWSVAGSPAAGHVHVSGAGCDCPSSDDPSWD